MTIIISYLRYQRVDEFAPFSFYLPATYIHLFISSCPFCIDWVYSGDIPFARLPSCYHFETFRIFAILLYNFTLLGSQIIYHNVSGMAWQSKTCIWHTVFSGSIWLYIIELVYLDKLFNIMMYCVCVSVSI